MKKIALILLMTVMLAGCSLLDSVNTTLNYTDAATTYVEDATSFAERAPQLAEQALMDQAAVSNFVQELETMKNEILSFNGIKAPEFAQDIHQQLLAYNETLLAEIDRILKQINLGSINWESIQDSQMLQTAREIAEVLLLLQQLGG